MGRPSCDYFAVEEADWFDFLDVGIRSRKRGRSTELSELTATVRSSVSYLCTVPRMFTNLDLSQRTTIPLDSTLSSQTQANRYSRLSGTKTP